MISMRVLSDSSSFFFTVGRAILGEIETPTRPCSWLCFLLAFVFFAVSPSSSLAPTKVSIFRVHTSGFFVAHTRAPHRFRFCQFAQIKNPTADRRNRPYFQHHTLLSRDVVKVPF
uniref:(northern house mosquito) hypothetical protein n=1 Tax=Culex pipiens TaxID=7175 RepID=A0A8D8CYE7_CULPI